MKTRLGLLIVFALSSQATAQTWPTFRNDHARSGFSYQALDAAKLELTWKWEAGLPPDPAWDGPARWDAFARIRDLPAMRQYDACFHPVSDGESVFFGSSSQDTLTALNLSDGSTRWQYVAGGPIRLAPTIEDDMVLFGCDDGNAYCLNTATGKLIWKFNPSAHQSAEQRRLINNDRLISFFPVRTGITVRDGHAYFAASFLPWRESYLCSIDVKTGTVGKLDNTFVVRHDNATLEGSLLVAEDRLIVPQGRVAPLLFDRTNGKNLGSLPGGGGVTIVLTESGDVVRAEGGRASRAGQVGVFKGKERIASFPRGRSLVIRGDSFYVIDGQKLFAAKRDTNELLWQRDIDEPLEIIMAGDTLFVGGRDHVTAVSAANGQVDWSAKTKGRVFGLAVAGGKLIASADTGNLYAFSTTAEADYQAKPTAIRVSPRVPTVRQKSLLHRWVFHRSAMESGNQRTIDGNFLKNVTVKDQAGNADLKLEGTAESLRIGDSEKVESIKLENSLFPIDESIAAELPTDSLAVEAWVRVNQPATWGGIIGCIQDDGATEHGWLLGYRSDKFCFAVAGGDSGLTYLTEDKSFKLGSWNHVVGTYNGNEMRLYVNGSLTAASTQETGPISYPDKPVFTVGAYKDINESFPMAGELHEVQVHTTPLSATTIARQYASKSREFPIRSPNLEPERSSRLVSHGPISRFVRKGTVEISYETNEKCPSVVDLITPEGIKRFVEETETTRHAITVSGLPFRREVQFQIRDSDSEQSNVSTGFTLDTHFDWTSSIKIPQTPLVKTLIDASPNPRGITFLLGAEFSDLAKQLSRQTELSIVLVVDDELEAQKIRDQWIASAPLRYGSELSVTTTPIRDLPGACASVVIAPTNDGAARRLVRPEGGILHDGTQVQWTRSGVEGSGTWSHMYGHADNSAFGGESLSDASSREDLLTQWIGRPGPRYQTDRQNRKPSPLAVGGRLFLQGQQRMIALDSFSGAVLWSVEAPTVMRWNVPHDCSNWCADKEGVFVAADDQAWLVDGRSGKVARRFQIPGNQRESPRKNWGYIARHEDQLIGSVVSASAIYTKWWGNTQWFDSTGGEDTHVVGSDSLFSIDRNTGELQWSYPGLILNPTITVMDGKIYFVEDLTPAHIESPLRRIALDRAQVHELVCLDVKTGELNWRQPLAPFAGHIACLYLAGGGSDDGRSLVLVASESTLSEFTVQTFDPLAGTPIWNRSVAWEANHHGKHISRPAIESELLYLRPEVLNLQTGETLQRGFPGGHGCASYALGKNGLFARLGETTWWDFRNEKVNRFSRIRTDCWISLVPAQGMLLSAEGGGGCSCGIWLETSLGFLPRSVDEDLPEK